MAEKILYCLDNQPKGKTLNKATIEQLKTMLGSDEVVNKEAKEW